MLQVSTKEDDTLSGYLCNCSYRMPSSRLSNVGIEEHIKCFVNFGTELSIKHTNEKNKIN